MKGAQLPQGTGKGTLRRNTEAHLSGPRATRRGGSTPRFRLEDLQAPAAPCSRRSMALLTSGAVGGGSAWQPVRQTPLPTPCFLSSLNCSTKLLLLLATTEVLLQRLLPSGQVKRLLLGKGEGTEDTLRLGSALSPSPVVPTARCTACPLQHCLCFIAPGLLRSPLSQDGCYDHVLLHT